MFAICGILTLCLAIIVVIIQTGFHNSNDAKKGILPVLNHNSANDSITTKEEEDFSDYEVLEDQLEKSAQAYIQKLLSVDSNILVTSSELIEKGYFDPLKDPKKEQSCYGYVIYELDPTRISSYLRCPTSYRTKGYQLELE